MHILFVDDTIETRNLFRLCFTLEGHTADMAESGREAIQIIEQTPSHPDVIIMDYHMPQMTGLEVVQQLRRKENLPATPIILFTGDAEGKFESEAAKLGVARVVYKPMLPGDLIALAREVVESAQTAP